MTLSVIAIVAILIFFIQGYRFNRSEGIIEQGGLVQLRSIPSGAALTIDSARLSATTSTKTNLRPGRHTIAMNRAGYRTWQKTVDVKKGSILWLNYARLIPEDLPVTNIAKLPDVTSTIVSPNRKWMAFTTNPDSPAITLFNLEDNTPAATTLTLPDDSYTNIPEGEAQTFSLSAWDSSNRYILLQHYYGSTSDWLLVDIENPNDTKNVSRFFDIPMTNIKFSATDSRVLYALTGGDLRIVNTKDSTMSAPLIRGVAEFSLYRDSTILYTTTLDPVTKQRLVGYYHEGANKPRAIRTYTDDGSAPLHITVGEYYDQTYIAVGYSNTIDILRGSLPRSDSAESLSLSAIATISLGGNVEYLSNKTSGRFFIAQHGKRYSVYDLELQKLTTTTLRGEGVPKKELGWLDDYTVWSGLDSMLRLYEFDGANQHDIMPIVPGQQPTLTANGRYLYAPTKDSKGVFRLSRVRLIL